MIDTSKGLMYFYRTIDLDDIFPNSNNDYSEKNLAIFREIGSNWSSEKGVDTQEEIEKTGEDVYLEDNLEYSYTLTQDKWLGLEHIITPRKNVALDMLTLILLVF